jgi:hypothetical protein
VAPPQGGDGDLSWDTGWAPYIDPGNYSSVISNASNNTFEDGMITAIALERLARLATETRANGTVSETNISSNFRSISLLDFAREL